MEGSLGGNEQLSGHSRKRKRLLEYRVCPHCKNMLKFKEFQEHRRLFYDATTKLWAREVMSDTSESDFEFSEDEVMLKRDTAVMPEPESDWDEDQDQLDNPPPELTDSRQPELPDAGEEGNCE